MEILALPRKEKEVIELHNISKEYRTGRIAVKALWGVDIDIENGEFVAIRGPSGSGKSTLMNLIGCLDRPTEGTYLLDGVRVDEMDEDELATVRNRKIGFIFQTFNLIGNQTALENVELPLLYAGMSKTREASLKALDEVGLRERVGHRPHELSGGEAQRVAIARAIVLEPSIILADEPTGNLDTRTGEEIIETFKLLNQKGTTVIIVTHERAVAEHTRRQINLLDGAVVSDTRENT
jgi:putative ABC transport system ATP-binding protein